MAARLDKDLRLPTDYRGLLTQVELCPVCSGFGTYVPRGGSRCWACDGQGIVWGEDARVLFVALHHRRIGIFDHVWPKYELLPPCQPWVGGMTLITSACRQEVCQLRGFSAHLRREQGYGRCFQYLPWDRDALNPERFVPLYDVLEGFWWPPRCQRCVERDSGEKSRTVTPTSMFSSEPLPITSGRTSRATSTEVRAYSVATQTRARTWMQSALSMTSVVVAARTVSVETQTVMTTPETTVELLEAAGKETSDGYIVDPNLDNFEWAYNAERMRCERHVEAFERALDELNKCRREVDQLREDKLELERRLAERDEGNVESGESQEHLVEVRELVQRLHEIVEGFGEHQESEELKIEENI